MSLPHLRCVLAWSPHSPFLSKKFGLRESRGDSATRAPEEIEIPATIQEIVAARLDHLRPAAKRVAQVAAVLGRRFGTEILSALVAGERIDVRAELAELERAGIVHRKNTAGADDYRFGESFTQEVAYDSLLLRERRDLHDRIGERLRNEDDRPLASRHAEVGRHFARGNDPERGVRTLLDAGEEAEALPSYGDAIRLYREAWDLAENALDEAGRPGRELQRGALRAALRLSNATVLYGATHAATDDRAAERGIRLARDLDDTVALARLHASRGMFVMNHGRERFEEGLDLIREGYAIARAAQNDYAVATLMRALAFSYLLDGRFADAERQIDETLDELDRLGQGEKLSDTYMGARFFRQRVLYESDRLVEAEAYGRETHRLAVRVNNRTLQSSSASGLAAVCFVTGRYEEALDWADEALRIAGEIENVGALRSASALRVLARAAHGDGPSRPADTETMQRGLLTSGDLAINIDLIVSALIVTGDTTRARKLAEIAVERASGRLREARHALALADANRAGHEGDLSCAHGFYEHARALGEQMGARSVRAHAHLGLGELAAVRGEHMIARRHVTTAAELFDEIGFVHYATRARRGLVASRRSPREIVEATRGSGQKRV